MNRNKGFNETQTTPKSQFDTNIFNGQNQNGDIRAILHNLKLLNEMCQSHFAKLDKGLSNLSKLNEVTEKLESAIERLASIPAPVPVPVQMRSAPVQTTLTLSALNAFASAENSAESLSVAREDLNAIAEDEKKLMEIVPERFEINSDGIINLTPANTPANIDDAKKKKVKSAKMPRAAKPARAK